MKTVLNKSIPMVETIDCKSSANYIQSEYNFSIDSYIGSSDNEDECGVVFTSTYDNNDDYSSSFFLTPSDAIKLGKSLIEKAIFAGEYSEYNDNLFVMRNTLLTDIQCGYIDTIVVKLHKKRYKLSNDPSVHIFNIYPIYKEDIQNNHFNFNIPLKAINCDSSGIIDPKEYLTTLFNVGETYINSLGLNEDELNLLYKLNNRIPGLINGFTKVKIKLVNCRQEFLKDEERELRKLEELKKKQEEIITDQSKDDKSIRNKEALRELIKSTPKKSDGSIDFNKIMELYNPE